jgi:pimeloyl-ACP methyl ester carboxylesterase
MQTIEQVSTRVLYKTIKINGLDIFYREAGSRDNPTVLLLHGFRHHRRCSAT